MASPFIGVWELLSDTEKAIRIFTETHACAVFERTNTRRGIAGTYTIQGNRIRYDNLVDTATDASPQTIVDSHIAGNIMTQTLVTAGTVSPVGHVDRWRKVSDLTRTSPHAGVWQIISDTDKGLTARTDTHWASVVYRGDYRRGFAGTYTADGNCLRHAILVDTDPNAPSHLDLELEREGDTFHVKVLAGSMRPSGTIRQWRKIA